MTTCWAGSPPVPVDCPLHVLASLRNSAFLFKCTHVALEPTGSCVRAPDE